MAHIAIVATDSWYIWNFRARTIQRLRDIGHTVTCYCGNPDYMSRLSDLGATTHLLALDGRRANPLREGLALMTLMRALQRDRPDVVLSFNPKGNFYTGLTRRLFRFGWIANVSGLGVLGEKKGAFGNLLRRLFRFSFGTVDRVIFQNAEDLDAWVADGIVPQVRTTRQFGSGVDLTDFPVVHPPSGPLNVVCLARLLEKKGIGDFIALAKKVRTTAPEVQFLLAGKPVPVAEGGVPSQIIEDAHRDGHITYLGMLDDVRPVVMQRTVGCLLTRYKEGVPRSMIEFLATGRPILISNFNGSHDLVGPHDSGKIVDLTRTDWIDDAADFVWRCQSDADFYDILCHNARTLAEHRFDGDVGIRDYVGMIEELLPV